MKLSENELDVLQALWNCNFGDGEYIECWSDCIMETTKIAKGLQISNAVMNLQKKNLVKSMGMGNDSTVLVTKEGIEIIKSKIKSGEIISKVHR